jgi:hypothetical protein
MFIHMAAPVMLSDQIQEIGISVETGIKTPRKTFPDFWLLAVRGHHCLLVLTPIARFLLDAVGGREAIRDKLHCQERALLDV